MIRVGGWVLDNIVYFKKAKLELHPGITVIRGLNKNSERVKRNTNAVGKSLLAGSFSNVIYAATPLATKKNEKRDLFGDKSSKITLNIKNGKTRWQVEQFTKGKSVGYRILKNGEDTKIHNATQAEAKIRSEIFPLSEELFYTTVMLSNLRFPTFIRGTAAQRHAFFTELFSMDHFQRVKAQFQIQLKELKSDKIKRDALKEQLADTELRLKSLSWATSNERELNTLSKQLEDLNTEYLEVMSHADELKAMLVIARRISYIKEKLGGVKEEDAEALTTVLKRLRYRLTNVREYDEWKRADKKYKKDITGLLEQKDKVDKALAECDIKGDRDDIQKNIDKLESRRDKLHADSVALRRLRVQYDDLMSRVPDKRPARSLRELHERHSELQQLVKLGRILKDAGKVSRCPVCLSSVSGKKILALISKAKLELPRVEADVEAHEGHRELKKIADSAKAYSGCEQALREVDKKLDLLQDKAQHLDKKLRLKRNKKDIETAISRVSRPAPVAKPEEGVTEEHTERRISKIEKQLTWLRELAAAYKEARLAFPKLISDAKISELLKEMSSNQSRLGKKIARINEKLPELLSKQKQWIQLSEDQSSTKAKIAKIDTRLVDLPIIEAIIKAYSSKGLKTVLMKELAGLVCGNLNLYAPLIFAEPFTFSMHITDTAFSVLVDRGNKKVSDINKLSGAETACFSLLLLLSTLPLIPNNKRTDMVLLDELDANLGEPLKELFVTKFLPMLSSIIPKIVVITTSKKLKFPDAAENLLIVKDGHVASIQPLLDFEGML
jgi:DNA repair exonuclease SbcCD ATPase subunit